MDIMNKVLITDGIVNRGLWKISFGSNSATLQFYSTAIWQHVVLNNVSWKNSVLFKFRYAITL